jgi:hypothetical protein
MGLDRRLLSLTFLSQQSFGYCPRAKRLRSNTGAGIVGLTTAFDKAWDKFKSSGSPLADDACAPSTRALLAKQIIDIAQKGERNIDRLVENGVTYLQEVK